MTMLVVHTAGGGVGLLKGGTSVSDYKLYQCVQCGFEYDEELGWPDEGIAPGTRWEDIPEDWSCPDCGAAKTDFVMVEVARS
ncbi:Rubredoxin [Mycobacterium basiliense]|uniref:Rubredoxin n=1 Tax=Mycobacterium basiliense TaxID=2094119 RepID=A0A3S4BCT0_9MYCO|nr:Rubredoxin [Mycobacterium basiliense]